MNPRCVLVALLAGATVALLASCSDRGKESEKPKAEDSPVKRGANGEVIVTLDAAAQKRIGLKVDNPAAAQWLSEIKGYGRVLDPAPIAALVSDLVSAHVTTRASQQELERLKTLAEQNNASARALQAAEAAANRDQLLVDSLRTRLILGWGQAILASADPPTFVRSLTTGESALVRIDLPAGQTLKTPPESARLVPLNDEDHPLTAAFFGAAPALDPLTQGQGFLFLLQGRTVAPGAAVTGYLRTSGEPLNGVIVPRAAALRHDGKAWVYVQAGDDSFSRREITLDRPTEDGWFISDGVGGNERLVVGGAQTILSEELSAGSFMSGARD